MSQGSCAGSTVITKVKRARVQVRREGHDVRN